MERLNFNHLFYFYIVSKEGSIKSAAEKLFVSQPTISDQIKLLEEFFDCLLFERKNRSLILTKEGALALKYAEQIFEQSRELTTRLRNKLEMPKRSLDIGITHFMSQYFLYDTLEPLFKQDQVSVNIVENQRHLLLAELEEGNVDIVFTDSKDSISSTMESYRIGVNKTFVIAHKKYRKHKKSFPESLGELPFFNYTNESFLKYEIELYFSKNSLSPRIIGEADDIDLIQMVAEKGLAYVIVPEVAKNRICQNKDVIVLGEITELETSVWGIIKSNYKGLGYKLLKKRL
ncbi:MAG: LysR family transcriptional activator of nhaA [Bacteriovoracaceae bacterium]|jgi:LysR family transcriptional activator of nhaA